MIVFADSYSVASLQATSVALAATGSRSNKLEPKHFIAYSYKEYESLAMLLSSKKGRHLIRVLHENMMNAAYALHYMCSSGGDCDEEDEEDSHTSRMDAIRLTSSERVRDIERASETAYEVKTACGRHSYHIFI